MYTNNHLFDQMSYFENNNVKDVKVKKSRAVELIQLVAIKDFH